MKTILAILLLLMGGAGQAQTIVKGADSNATLENRLQWAIHETKARNFSGDTWVAYSFERLCHENEFVGTFYTEGTRHPTLAEMVTGVKIQSQHTNSNGPGPKVIKETAVLLAFHPGKASPYRVRVNDLSLSFDLQNRPLLWLGNVPIEQSIEFLKSTYALVDGESKQEVISALGLHRKPALVEPFLKTLFLKEKDESIRGEAAFWLSAQDDPAAIQFLTPLLEKETSTEVIDQALAGLEDNEGDSATNLLIEWSGPRHSMPLRKQAIFWLGQIAGREAVQRIKDTAFADPDEEVEKQALIALSEIDHDGIPGLIEIAKKHPNPKIRKEAIYMLGDSGDVRAREALVQILESLKR